MVGIEKFKVKPYLPEKLESLREIAGNLWWVWNFEAFELFKRIDVELWEEVDHNPVRLLGSVSQSVLDELAESESFIAHMEKVHEELKWHLFRKSWYDDTDDNPDDAMIAYFSMEFGLHESLPVYSGGLGVLAGDHLKSASELGIPLCGVGLLYRRGYFRQYLNFDGWQQERFPDFDFYNLPIREIERDGQPLIIEVEFPGRNLYAKVWELLVGRTRLFFLDANIDQNSPDDKAVTDYLYGGDHEMRVMQEKLLAVGGIRLLRELGIQVTVFHMNEGHAAFLSLERIRLAMEEYHMNFDEARVFVSGSNVFTTHTPVPAGNDRFDPALVDLHFSSYYEKFGISQKEFMALGREDPEDDKELFCMTVLAIKTAAGCNGVSRLHGHVSRNMWKNIWPHLPKDEIPIGHVTNGIQNLAWTSDEMMRLFNRYLGPRWIDNPTDSSIWESIDLIPDSELWRARVRLRERLVSFARQRLYRQLINRGVPPREAEMAHSVLDSDALTIGFARRFATYKRATLLLRDIERLASILNDKERPIQIIFAGKAHPRDNMGKELIKQIIHLTRDGRFRDRVVFLEDYDINLARYLVQGVDVWLNTPIRPKEASGTSGMKVIPNGGLNISVLDGWWDEAYNMENGWAIGKGEEYDDQGYQDEVESLSLYDILEKEVKASFYQKGVSGIPQDWIKRVKESMKSLIGEFNTNRMIKDYTEMYYRSAHHKGRTLIKDNGAVARDVANWKKTIQEKWKGVKVLDTRRGESGEVTVGSPLQITTEIELGSLTPDQVEVELYFGSVNQNNEITNGVALPMKHVSNENGKHTYQGQILCLKSGQFAYTVRVIPYHPERVRKFDPDLPVTWK